MSNLCCSINLEDDEEEEDQNSFFQEDKVEKPQWRKDYEHGCGLEVYEVELSALYSSRQATFMETVVDILEQTGGGVYLVGLVEIKPDAKVVLVNPGPKYPIKAPSGGLKIMGVFLAADREAILQCDIGSVFLGRRERPNAQEGGGKRKRRAVGPNKRDEDIPEIQHLTIPLEAKIAATKIARVVRKHRRALQPPRPPLKMLAQGGHIVLLAVGTTTNEDLRLGIEHFVQPLRVSTAPEFFIPVVVLSEIQPRDWIDVEDQEKVYFLQGSPTSYADLQRIHFSGASAIFISHCGSARGAGNASWKSDFEVICCTRLVESRLPPNSNTLVIADIINESNHPFLPLSGTRGDKKDNNAPSKPQRQADGGDGARATLKKLGSSLFGLEDGEEEGRKKFSLKRLGSTLSEAAGKSESPAPDAEEGKKAQVSDLHFLQPRFAAGRLFAGSTTFTCLAANTLYNPSLIELVSTMISTQIMTIRLPIQWEGKTYMELFEHLLWNQKILAIGIYRLADMLEAPAVKKKGPKGSVAQDEDKKSGVARMGFVFTAPPGKETVMLNGDSVICFQAHQGLGFD
eukprot:TRINITY_DN19623_c0_g1_i1.p1 TRINITY_DN19623_c0_g1~~TRINITY_DN19623_c0_g1_i1.p1  ORF type:complete len:648 (-),score=112.61 TRINITY_DN19623_c0_g1_i1:96-1808(-)